MFCHVNFYIREGSEGRRAGGPDGGTGGTFCIHSRKSPAVVEYIKPAPVLSCNCTSGFVNLVDFFCDFVTRPFKFKRYFI